MLRIQDKNVTNQEAKIIVNKKVDNVNKNAYKRCDCFEIIDKIQIYQD